jgi:hypothetical protein
MLGFLGSFRQNTGGRCIDDVVDRDRQHGRSKYGVIDRAIVGFFDLIGVG